MADKLSGVELRRAHLVPSSVFASPEAVLEARDLSRAEMIRILRRWEFDLQRSWRLRPPEQDLMLDRVRDALALLELRPSLGGEAPAIRH